MDKFLVGFFLGMLSVRVLQVIAEDARYRAEWDAYAAGAAAQREYMSDGA
jgi:hypothetical protein